jgi:hypothetical protein
MKTPPYGGAFSGIWDKKIIGKLYCKKWFEIFIENEIKKII